MATCFQVKDWSSNYENNRTKELRKMTWVPVPNRMDGDGYTELLDHPNGAAHFGAWNAIVQIASKCEPRGTLLRDCGRPHTSQSLARMSRIPAAVFEEALDRLVEIGWLERLGTPDQQDTRIPHEGATIPPQGAASRARAPERKGTEGNGMRENGTERARGDSLSLIPPAVSSDENFRTTMGVFLSFGVETSETDLMLVAREWVSLEPHEQVEAKRYAEEQTRGEWRRRETRYIPRPKNYLHEKQWERTAPPRTIKQVSKAEENWELADKLFRGEEQ